MIEVSIQALLKAARGRLCLPPDGTAEKIRKKKKSKCLSDRLFLVSEECEDERAYEEIHGC